MTRRDRVDDADPPGGGGPDPDREHSVDDVDSGADARLSASDPRRIGSVAVTGSDVIDALEATARGGREIVLRITPPFSGRMRARLHDAGAVDAADDPGAAAGESDGDATDAAPVHLPPERLVADPPAYPTVDDTEDELRASDTPYTRERHHERHQAAVEAWRATVRERLVEEVTLHTDAGPATVSVSYLG
jgi:hypothetical protein